MDVFHRRGAEGVVLFTGGYELRVNAGIADECIDLAETRYGEFEERQLVFPGGYIALKGVGVAADFVCNGLDAVQGSVCKYFGRSGSEVFCDSEADSLGGASYYDDFSLDSFSEGGVRLGGG